MRLFKQTLKVAIVAIAMITTSAQASVTGSIWENDLTGAQNAIPSNVPLTTPDVTFTTPSINFSSGGLYTIGEFLSSGSGSTVLTGSSQLGNTLDNTLFDFQGTVSVTNGQSFIAGHDDGLTLVINGQTVISAPGPTSFTTTPSVYTGPTGTYAFNLVYGECCGAPADLQISLPLISAPVPEPETYAMLLAGLGLMGFMVRRKQSA